MEEVESLKSAYASSDQHEEAHIQFHRLAILGSKRHPLSEDFRILVLSSYGLCRNRPWALCMHML